MGSDRNGNGEALSAFGRALDAVLMRNRLSGADPGSVRALGFALARDKHGADATERQADDERRVLRRYRKGERNPRKATVERIARVSGASVDELPVQGKPRQVVRDLERRLAESERARDELLRELEEERRRRPGTP